MWLCWGLGASRYKLAVKNPYFYRCLGIYLFHSHGNCTHIDPHMYTLMWLFPMFGGETQAIQPLKTGDNICPPSFSVLPSIMVRPFSPLWLIIPPFPCLRFFFSSFTPPFFLLLTHYPVCHASRARSQMLLLLSFFYCSLFPLSTFCLWDDIFTFSPGSPYCLQSFEYMLLFSVHYYLSFALDSFLHMMNVPVCLCTF